MRDRVAKWVYLSVKQGGFACQLIQMLYRLQRGAAAFLRMLIRLVNPSFFPNLYNRGDRVWSTEMFNEQLRRDGL